MRSPMAAGIVSNGGADHAVVLIRQVIGSLRQMLSNQPDVDEFSKEALLAIAESELRNLWRSEQLTGTHRVINATGVVIQSWPSHSGIVGSLLIASINGVCGMFV